MSPSVHCEPTIDYHGAEARYVTARNVAPDMVRAVADVLEAYGSVTVDADTVRALIADTHEDKTLEVVAATAWARVRDEVEPGWRPDDPEMAYMKRLVAEIQASCATAAN